MVGPFIFMDHMGPAKMAPQQGMDVLPHPHIGLATITYLFEGHIMHRDSIGTVQEIRPGAVNWMSAGRGIVHSERTPGEDRSGETILHGIQTWVALPKAREGSDPFFYHVKKEDVPRWKDDSCDYSLIVGEAFGLKSPVPTDSHMFYVDMVVSKDTTIRTKEHLRGEFAIYVLKGKIEVAGQVVTDANLAVFELDEYPDIKVEGGTHLMVIGGETFPEERHIFWNFVHSDAEVIEKAKQDWKAGNFPRIEGEEGFVPLPE
jgi:redox-sensitive bicupin YhaK (pirin superfamily)